MSIFILAVEYISKVIQRLHVVCTQSESRLHVYVLNTKVLLYRLCWISPDSLSSDTDSDGHTFLVIQEIVVIV